MQENIGVRQCFHMFSIDMGPTSAYMGLPTGEGYKYLWPNYPMAFHLHGREADTVLIDGRFRVACALIVWLSGKVTTKVMMHDYYRIDYHVVETLFDVVEQAEALVVLQPNSRKHASSMWRKHAVDLYSFYQYELA
jgi:protein O-GlcNAc transferase